MKTLINRTREEDSREENCDL